MEKDKDKRSSVDLRQAQREAAEKFAAAKERGDLVAAESALNEFSEQMRAFREPLDVLGPNFLGVAAWKNIGVDVGEAPPLPKSLTLELLNSECPLHPGQKIKDTHILVLVPKAVNGEPYSALKLDKLCATRKGSRDKLICDRSPSGWEWKELAWVGGPQAQSEWVLIPKSDPDPERMREKYGDEEGDKRHFRSKSIAEQAMVHAEHYTEYREVKVVELMTAVMMYGFTHKELLLPDFLVCEEPGVFGAPVCVGYVNGVGLGVEVFLCLKKFRPPNFSIGRALARKL